MVNPARFLAAVGGQLQKRDDTTSWSSIISTSFLFVSEPTSVTVFGYYTTTRAVVDGSAVVSTLNYTTSTTASWATSPLTSTTSLDPSCSTGYSAYLEDLLFITDLTFGDPTFAVGYNEPCLPTGFGTVGYYSPGLCPSGYTVALERTFSSSKTNTRFLETQGICCFNSFTLQTTSDPWHCETYFNPLAATTGSVRPTSTAPITSWTVTAEYTTATESTSVFNTAAVSGSAITTVPTTSYSTLGTASQLTVITGGYGATVLAMYIDVRWQTTDKVVMDWLKQQPGISIPHGNATGTPTPPPPGPHGLKTGAIVGIVIGAIAVLALLIGALVFFLRRRKRMSQTAPSTYEDMAEHQSVQPKGYSQGTHEDPSMSPSTQKSELDSRSLSQTQYLSLSNTSPSQGVQSKPFMSPTISELPVSSPTESIAGNTLNEGSRSPPTEWNEQRPPSHVSSSLPETDMHGFLISAPGPGPATPQLARSSWLEQQQKQVKEEKARLTRLQELSEMEARLEEQLQRELAEERRS